MSELSIDLWTIAIGILCNVSCALLGCYLVLRRMSLIGDAISHAVLPGIVVAFVIAQSRASVPMFLGAMSVGVLTAFLTQTLHRFANVSQDTSMGVVFTTLFALGVVLLRVIPGMDAVDLDPSCVFEGNIEFEALYRVDFFGLEVPRSMPMLVSALVVNLAFMTLLWKELKLATFDPALSSALGFSAGLIFYVLMALVAATTVASFWAVGSILVIAMLIVPGATAHLLTDRLGAMVAVACVIAIFSSIGGYYLADHWNTSAAGMMAVVAGAQYVVAMVFGPRYGVLVRWVRNAAMALRIASEDILAAVYRWDESRSGESFPRKELARATHSGRLWRLGLWLLRWRGQIFGEGGRLRLTDAGRSVAAELVRSHRLWESYLAEHVGLPSDHLHEPAMRMEHYVTPEIERELVADLADTKIDPHGRPIPAKEKEERGRERRDADADR